MDSLASLLDFLVAHGPTVALGATLVLGAGCGVMACSRRASERRRFGVLTALACALYLALAWLPLPRWSLPEDLAPAPVVRVPAVVNVDAPPVDPAQRAAALLAALDRLESTAPASERTPAPIAVPATATWPWPRFVALGWLVLAAAVLLRAGLGLLRLGACLRATSPGPAALLAAAGAPRGTRLHIAATAVRPFCAFWGRPVIVLPQALLAPERTRQTLAVLRHEAAHLRAGDPFVQLLLSALAAPLAWHPLFWWLARDVRFHAELLADDAAAAAIGSTAYARDLLDLADQPGPALAAAGTVPVFHRPSEFFRRIQMLLQRDGRLSTSASRLRRLTQVLATGAVVAAVTGLLGVPASAQDPEPSRNLRTQNERLRTEIEALRVELKELRDLIDQQRQGQQPGVPMLQDVPVLGHPFHQPPLAATNVPPSQDPLAEFHRTPMSDATRKMLIQMHNVANSRSYGVEKGDSFANIAEKELGSPDRADEIARLNPGVDPQTLRPGQRINLPPTTPEHPPQDPGASGTPPAAVPAFPPGEHDPAQRAHLLQLNNLLLADQMARARSDESAQPNDRVTGASTSEAVAGLTTRCLDLQAEVEVAEAEAEQVNALAKQGTASNLEAKRATTKLASLQRKLTIVRQLIDGEIKASEAELSWLERKMKEGDKTDRLRLEVQVQRARTRIQALKSAR